MRRGPAQPCDPHQPEAKDDPSRSCQEQSTQRKYASSIRASEPVRRARLRQADRDAIVDSRYHEPQGAALNIQQFLSYFGIASAGLKHY